MLIGRVRASTDDQVNSPQVAELKKANLPRKGVRPPELHGLLDPLCKADVLAVWKLGRLLKVHPAIVSRLMDRAEASQHRIQSDTSGEGTFGGPAS